MPMSTKQSKFVYATVVAICALAIVAAVFSRDLGAKEIAGALLALIGTFLGALFAFRLNQEKERQQELRDQKAALNRSLFILHRQYNALVVYGKHLASRSLPVERALMLPAQKPPTYSDLTQNFTDLEFLLETKYANSLMRLTIEQERFEQALESVRLRNEFYVHEVQPALERMNVQGKSVTEEELRKGLGERIFGTAMTSSIEMYNHVPSCTVSIKAMHEELFKAAKGVFPDAKFIMPPAA